MAIISTWRALANFPNNASSYTTPALFTGTASSTRRVVVGLQTCGTSAAPAITGVTIGGVAAAEIAKVATGSSNGLSAFWGAAVPAGTTAVVAITLSTLCERFSVDLWTLEGLTSLTPFDTAMDATSPSHILDGVIDCAAGGAVLGIAQNNSNTMSWTWTGLTERSDRESEATKSRVTAASDAFGTAQTARAITAKKTASANSAPAMLLVSLSPSSATPPGSIPKRRSYDTVQMLGFNVNCNVSGGAITQSRIMQAIGYLGFNGLRTPFLTPNKPGSLAAMVDLGVRLGSVHLARSTTYTAMKAELTEIQSFLAARPNSIEGVEGMNEIGNFGGPFTYTDRNGVAHPPDATNDYAISYQNDLYYAMRTDPLFPGLRNVDARHFTGPPSIAEGACNSLNFHPYAHPSEGDLPQRVWDYYKERSDMDPYPTPPNTQRVVFTEAGFSSSPTYVPKWYVDEATASILTITSVFCCIELAIHRIYIYELFDGGGGSQSQQGVFYGESDGNKVTWDPKPSADALHNFTTIISDTGATKATFTLASLNYSISGLPATAKHTLIQCSNGDHFILIWNHSDPIWAYPAATPIMPADSHILTANVPAGKSTQWFSPCESPVAGFGAAATRTLRKFPLIVRVF